MSQGRVTIQCVIVKGSDNVKEEGSPNDKLRDVYQTGLMGSPIVTIKVTWDDKVAEAVTKNIVYSEVLLQ